MKRKNRSKKKKKVERCSKTTESEMIKIPPPSTQSCSEQIFIVTVTTDAHLHQPPWIT